MFSVSLLFQASSLQYAFLAQEEVRKAELEEEVRSLSNTSLCLHEEFQFKNNLLKITF